MAKRLKVIIGIELLILVALFIHIAKTPHMWLMVLLALVFTFLANRSRAKIFRLISAVFWIISALILFSVGWFWAAVFFPAIMCLVFWKNNPRMEDQSGPRNFYQEFQDDTEAPKEELTKANGNDIIDLDTLNYRPAGNALSIKKNSGNTKIIVPKDVEVILDITVDTGIVKIFDEAAKINAGNIRYFSDPTQHFKKRVRITIRVQTGNVEIVHG